MNATTKASGAGRQTPGFTPKPLPMRGRGEISGGERFDPSTPYQHTPVLWAYAVSRLRDPALADDVVQETFSAALSGAGQRFIGESAVWTWLVAILKHKIVDVLRERARAPSYFDAIPGHHPEDTLRDSQGAPPHPYREPTVCRAREPDAMLAFSRFVEACQQCLDELPSQSARVFVLSEVLGHATEEVSIELGISTANVWVTRHRTRKSLRRSLESARPV